MSTSRRGFSKNLKGIDTRAVTADNIVGSIQATTVSADDITVNSVSISNLDLSGGTNTIDFVNRDITNVSIISGSISGTTISSSDISANTLSVSGDTTLGGIVSLQGTSGQSVSWQPSTNILSASTGVQFQPGEISMSGNTISPKTFGGTIAFTGNVDFTNANAFGIGQTSSPFIVDNVSITNNDVTTISGALRLSSSTNNVQIIGNAIISAGSIDSTPIGFSIPSSGSFTSLSSTTSATNTISISSELSFPNSGSVMNIADASTSSLEISDGISTLVRFDTTNNLVEFVGDVIVTGTLLSGTSTIKDIITPFDITIQSTNDRVRIESNGTESGAGFADSIYLLSTNANSGIRLQSNGVSGILATTTSGNIRLEPGASYDVTCTSDIISSGGYGVASFLGSPSAGSLQWNGSRMQAYTGSVWRDMFGVKTHTEIDNHINDVTGNPHAVTASQTGALPLTGGIMTGSISMSNSFRVNNMIDPVSPQDAATKNYVDSTGGSSDNVNLRTYLGINALSSVVGATSVSAFGVNALSSVVNGSTNVAFGENAGTTIVNGTGNICIGIGSDVSAAGATNQIAIGHSATATTNGEMYISSSCTHIRMDGISTHSGGRLVTKENGTNRMRIATTMPVYADNTAATVGGLTAGDLYRTSAGLLAIVF